MKHSQKKFTDGELEQPETLFVRDIENRVFQSIVLQCLSKISGITLVEGNFFDHILGRSTRDQPIKGIFAEQDPSNPSVTIKIEVNVCYGISIPKKAEEIQTIVSNEITELTGLHVGCVHVIVKNVVIDPASSPPSATVTIEERKKKEPPFPTPKEVGIH